MATRKQEKPARGRVQPIVLFLLIFAGELLFGIYLSYYRDFVYYDAVSRVANAFYVLFSRDPHMGAIGFVWNPLPSLLELIPLLLWKLAPAVATAGLASNILTALFSAGTATILFGYARSQTNSLWIAYLTVAGFALNPFVFLYGANGMSEAMFIFFIVWMVVAYTKWLRDEQSFYPIQMSFALALAFWVRYESMALGLALAIGIATSALDRRYRTGSRSAPRLLLDRDLAYSRAESTLLVVLTPAVFSGFAWMLLNYMIMGDPLFFFRSGYSNMAFSGNLTESFRELISTPSGVLSLVLRKSAWFSVPLGCMLLLRLADGRWRRWETLALLLLAASIPGMQFLMLLKGSSFGWLRFFVYPFVVAAAWLPYELSQLRSSRRYRTIAAALIAALFVSAFVVRDMDNHELSPDEYETFHIEESGTYKDLKVAREVSAYTNKLFANAAPGERPVILTDSYSAYSVLLNSRYPRQWIITNDRDFKHALLHPQEDGVDYILVSRQIGSVLQIIHETYPDLFEKGEPWAELARDFGGEWKLYRVVGT